MAGLLQRIETEASALFRAHPPKIHHRQKQAIFELAGGAMREPAGSISISRWAPSSTDAVVVGPPCAVPSLEGAFTYDTPPQAWHVNFADTELFAFYGTSAFAQDEIQVAEHPLLASVRGLLLETGRAVTREKDRPTPVLVRDVERWCAIDTHGIYGRRLSLATDEALGRAVRRIEPATRSNILAMVAPQGHGSYSREQIEDILLTAITAFAAARAESGADVRIHTGHWGTGAFGGDRVLMAAAQVLAARAAEIRFLAYHSLDGDAAEAFAEGLQLANTIPAGTTFAAAVDRLEREAFRWGDSDGN